MRSINLRQKSDLERRERDPSDKIDTEAKLISLSAKLRWPRLLLFSLSMTTRYVDLGQKYTVLVLSRAIFDDDIDSMVRFSGKINYIFLPKAALIHLSAAFLPVEEVFNHRGYHQSDQYSQEKDRYFRFLCELVPLFKRLWKIDAIVGANYVQAWHQELARACATCSVPFIVLHKEALAPKTNYEGLVKRYSSYKFIGSKLVTYNEPMRDALVKCGVEGLTQDNAIAVGPPRLDTYPRNRTSAGDYVLFFSFYPIDKFTFLVESKKLYEELIQRGIEFHRQFFLFAAKHPEIQFRVKTKVNPRYLQFVQEVHDTVSKEPLGNVIFSNTANVEDLVLNSKLIIGFNSITLIEGLLAGKRIVSPRFDDLISDPAWYYFNGFSDLTEYASTAEELENCILSNKEDVLSRDYERVEEFCRPFIFSADGRAGERAEREIITSILEAKGER